MTTRYTDAEQTRQWYQERLRKFGYSHEGLGYNQKKSQGKRFAALAGLGRFDGRSVLDVGCGFGDFLSFLLEGGQKPQYTGLDLCQEMVALCRRRFGPEAGARFDRADVLEFRPEGAYDYVVACGIFGFGSSGAEERVAPSLERMFSWCRRGLAVNFLSRRSPRQSEGRLYLEPEALLRAALALTPAVRLDHSYLPNDFTLCLYKTPGWAAD